MNNLDINEYDQYAALAETIKIKDITSNKQNQTILQQLRDNNEAFNELSIESCENDGQYSSHFYPRSSKELAWLGYFLGRNTNVKELKIGASPPPSCYAGSEVFRRGLSHNRSIEKILLDGRLEGNVFQLLHPFMKNNSRLQKFEVDECELEVEGIRQFSLALGECSKSLIHVRINAAHIRSGQLADIITALSVHPQLEELDVSHIYPELGINDCTALSTLLRHTITNLQRLILDCNCMNDEGLGIIVNGLSHGSMLKDLFIVGHDQDIHRMVGSH